MFKIEKRKNVYYEFKKYIYCIRIIINIHVFFNYYINYFKTSSDKELF